jgi:hypothetical protein
MGERPSQRSTRRRRVLVEDARRSGHHLRATWHPEERQFVVSTWSRDVCTGAARLEVEAAATLAGLIVDGLTDAAAPRPSAPPAVPATRPGLPGLVDRLRWLVRGTAPRPPAPAQARPADVHPLQRRPA